jgi:hypothetical protein
MSNNAVHPTYENIEIVKLNPSTELRDYRDAIHLSNRVADNKLGAYMLLSWYDRDRDFESPQHSSTRHSNSTVPGYVDYGLYNGATLKVDIDDGRFVFFYLPTDL